MKCSPVHASLLALALFAAAGPARADAAVAGAPVRLAQAEDSASQQFDAVQKFLAGTQDVSQLDDDKLQKRLRRAKKLRETEGLPPELDQQLQQTIAALEAEIGRRQQAGQAAPDLQQQAQPDSQEQAAAPKIEEPPLPPATGEGQPAPDQQAQAAPSQDIAAFLASVRPASELSPRELREQMRRAMELSQGGDVPQEQRRALKDVIREARAVLRGKSNGNGNDAGTAGGEAQAPAAEEAAPPVAQQQAAPEAQPQPAPQSEQQLAKPSNVDPAKEQQARAILDDTVDVRQMKRHQLRQRLATIRDLLATNELSLETREALRRKLASERQVLRSEVAVEEGTAPPPQQPQAQQPAPGTTNNTANTTITTNNMTVTNNTTVNNTDVRIVLKDRRPPDQLKDDELVRRIDVYREVVADDRYAEEERMAWRQQMEFDRQVLRQRMIAERRQREARLRAGNIELSFRVEDRYDPSRDVPDDAFAAEVDDSELADVLTAPPRRKIQRRYTIDDIERMPEARNAVARIEIDTVHFGFGEGFLREEEIDKLDRIAQVLEKILAMHPDEVFLIEGHTDAVGSDQANLVLSRQRAQAVKEALTTYYVIPAENLKTVGLGERYLKIPTDQPEAENRRVSLARITALVGQRN